jgi:hypothetical protein
LVKLFQKIVNQKTLIVGLLVTVIVLSFLLVAFTVPPILSRLLAPSYGDFTFGCPVLQAKPSFNDSLVRWVTLTCPNGPAISLIPSSTTCGYREPTCTRIYPTFTPPPGLMGLYLYNHGTAYCPNTQTGNGPTGMFPLENRVDLVYYHIDHPTDLDYCAVVKQSTGTLDGFTVQWTAGEGGGGSVNRITASVTNATVKLGDSATLTLRVMNHYSLGVTLHFAKDLTFLSPNPNSTFAGISFSPPAVTVGPGGSNSTTVTLTTSTSQIPGNYEVGLDADPIYGLRFYGDYGPTASYSGGGAITYLKLTS